jgi:tripartite-type tricarboxylate transporter receptor subunit TctC
MAVLLTAACFGAAPAGADVAGFYKGNTVEVLIGFSSGGGFDAYGRLVARNIGRHIPGGPTVVAKNAPGAGSAKAVRSLEARPKDGTVIVAFNPGLVLRSMTEPKKVKIRFTDVALIGSVSANVGVCYMWHTKGVKTWNDLTKKKQIILGATAKGTSAYIEGTLLKNLFNLPVKMIIGYPGSRDVMLAVERGELDGNCGTWQSIPANWRRDKKIFVTYTYTKTKPEGIDAPYLLDLAKDEAQRKMLRMVVAYNDIFRPFAVARGILEDRLKALRDALWATVHDKAFLAEAERAKRPIIGPLRGEKMDRIIAEMYATPPDLIKKAAVAIK